MSMPAPGIGRQMAKGALWMVLARFGVRAIGLLSTIILARILVPADFGLVALATTIVSGLEVFSLFSFDLALIRDTKATRDHYDTAWTLSILRGLLIALLLLAGAGVIADFFNDPRLVPVMWALAAVSAAEGFQNIAVVNFRKDMNFHLEFRFLVAQKVVAFIVTLTCALLWRHYWALLAGIAASRMAGLIMSYVMVKYRPHLCLREWKSLIGFAKWLLLNNIIWFFGNWLDQLTLGRMLGAHQLGLYNVAKEIASLPTSELIMPIQRALFPGFSRIKDDQDLLRRTFLDSSGMIMFLALPAAAGIALVADPLVRLFLGEKWLDAIALLQILAFYGMTRIGQANIGSVLLALGRLAVLNTLGIIYIVIQLALLWTAINIAGATGAALAVVGASAVHLVASLAVTLYFLQLSPASLVKVIWRPIVAASMMGGALYLLEDLWPTAQSAATLGALICAIVVIGALVYYSANLLLWYLCGRPEGVETTLLKEIEQQLERRRVDRLKPGL